LDEFRVRARILDPLTTADREKLRGFLAPLGLDFEDDIELSAAVEDNGTLVATASLAGDIIKCVGVLPGREGEGAAARAVSTIIAEAHARKRNRLFIYTKPGNRVIFEDLGFVTLAEVDHAADQRDGVTLLENDPHAFDSWVQAIRKRLPSGTADSAVVVNCNPFTLGHRYLIESSAAACAETGGTLLVLVVAGNRSSFPGDVREALVRSGTTDIGNVTVASGDAYCVSGATFPAYYLKKKSGAADLQAELDATLFATRIAPELGIRRRFVGTEPYCAVTSAYNKALAAVLPANGIELVTIKRAERDGVAISASAVRSALRDGDLERAAALVPPSTAAWLRTPEAAAVLERIRTGDGRH
jgi:[citrate (pro-3S)-lyase] ligase